MQILKYFREVKSEALRVSWPKRNEVLMSIGLVLVVAVLTGLFFFIVDSVIYKFISFLLGI